MRILVVEDDTKLAAALAEALGGELYTVDLAGTGAEAEEWMAGNEYDLAVLDWSIPPPLGPELVAAWRKRGLSMPVLMLTGRGEVSDRIHGLDAGADDYLTKPFAIGELLARVRSLLRRGERPLAALEAGAMVMDRAGRRVAVAGRDVRLTPKEFAVLEYLLTHRDQVVSRGTIEEHVWQGDLEPMSNTLEVILSRLRKKLENAGASGLIQTVPGAGYRLASGKT